MEKDKREEIISEIKRLKIKEREIQIEIMKLKNKISLLSLEGENASNQRGP